MSQSTDGRGLIVFDTETTGVDVESDRIVTAFVGHMNRAGEWVEKRSWLVNPGVDIPTEASDIHGITTEHAREHGTSPALAIPEIAHILSEWADEDHPLVVYNAPFDLTLLDRELRRYIGSGLDPAVYRTVLDPLVIDKAIDRYRRGSRKLTAVAAEYGVPVEGNAHDAEADCLMAGRLAWKLMAETQLPPSVLHEHSVEWKQVQAESLQEYFRKTDPEAVVSGDWPITTKEETK